MKGWDALRSANIISLYFIANQDVVNCCRSYSVFWNGVHEQDLVCNMLIGRIIGPESHLCPQKDLILWTVSL